MKSNFSFSHSVFYLFGELSAIFLEVEIVVCKLFSVWKSLKFVVWERVKTGLFGTGLIILNYALYSDLCERYSKYNKVFNHLPHNPKPSRARVKEKIL